MNSSESLAEQQAIGLLRYDDFDYSERLLKLLIAIKPSLYQLMVKHTPDPQWLKLEDRDLQNLLVHADDTALARFSALCNPALSERLLANVSQRRLSERLLDLIVEFKEGYKEETYEGQKRLLHYLAYMFLYQKIKIYYQQLKIT